VNPLMATLHQLDSHQIVRLTAGIEKELSMGKLTGKVAVVTGASKGIGAAIARKFGAEGAKVVVSYATDKSGAGQVVRDIESTGSKAVAVKANLADASQVGPLFTEAKKAFGKIDILVNNAGVYEFRPLDQIDEQHFRKHFDLNVLGLLLATRAAVENLNGDGGSIINVSSIASKTPPAGSTVYSATKGAVDVLTRTLAVELGPKKIRVNTLAPGVTDTEGVRALPEDGPEFRNYAVSRTPLGRVGTVDDIASAALFLASDDSRWITGEEILVGGGIRL
jgi:3-oxoacyl-[acyl-carrier protein] reductase